MKREELLLLLASAVITWPADAAAQGWAAVTEGDRIRLSAPEVRQPGVIGEVLAASADTLRMNSWEPIDRRWEVLEVPIRSIRTLEVNRGTRSNAGKGAILGGVIGGAFGLAAGIAAAAYDCDVDPWDGDGCWYWGEPEIVPVSTITFALLGAGVGALIGSASRTEVWEPIPAERLHVRVSRSREGGVSLALSLGL